jgi:hypothetical protein
MGLAIGMTLGTLITYVVMNVNETKEIKKYEDQNLTLQEKLSLEIRKLTLKNTTYNYVDAIEETINSLKEKDSNYVVKSGMYLLNNNYVFTLVDKESLKPIADSTTITNIPFGDTKPKENSMVYVNEKGKVTEGVFYVENFQIKYDLIGTKVTQITK